MPPFKVLAVPALLAAVAASFIAPIDGMGPWMVTAAIVVATGTLVHQATGIAPSRLSIPGVWFLTYAGLMLIPAHWLAAENAQNEAVDRFVIAVRLGAVATAVGVWFGARMLGFRRSDLARQLREPVTAAGFGPYFTLVYGALAVVALLLTAQYFQEAPGIPLLDVLQHPGDYLFLTFLREESFKLLDSPFRYAYFVLRVFGYPFLITVALGMYRCTRHRGWLVAFVGLGALGLFFAGASLAKWPVATIVVIVLFYHYLFVGGRLKTGTLLLGALVFVAFPVAVYIGMSEDLRLSVGQALVEVGRRMFYAPAQSVYGYFEAVPALADFQGGRTIGLLSRFLGWQPFDIENLVAVAIERSDIPSASANAAYVANLYADWGFPGVALGGLLTGGLLSAAHGLVTRVRRTPVTLAATAHLMFTAIVLQSTSLPTVLMSNGALLAVVTVLALPRGVSILREALAAPAAGLARGADA